MTVVSSTLTQDTLVGATAGPLVREKLVLCRELKRDFKNEARTRIRSLPGERGGRSVFNRAVISPVVFTPRSGALTIPVRQSHSGPITPGGRPEAEGSLL